MVVRMNDKKHTASWMGYPDDLQDNTLEPPTLDISKRPIIHNDDGSWSSLVSMGVNLDGKEVLLPTVSKDGTHMTPDEAVAEYKLTGEHMGVYPDWQTSDWAGQRAHEWQATVAPPKPTMHVMPTQEIEGRVQQTDSSFPGWLQKLAAMFGGKR
jgi:hypothetical protein